MRSQIDAWKEQIRQEEENLDTEIPEQEDLLPIIDDKPMEQIISPPIRTKKRNKSEILGIQRHPQKSKRRTFQNKRYGIARPPRPTWKYYNTLTLIKSFSKNTTQNENTGGKFTSWPQQNRDWEIQNKNQNSDLESDDDLVSFACSFIFSFLLILIID